MSQCSLKVLDQTFTSFHTRIRAFNHPTSCDRDKPRFALGGFFGFRGFGCQLESDLSHNPRIECLQGGCDLVRVVAVACAQL